MKRSVNFSHTRKPRNSTNDIAAFLQDIGVTSADLRADSRFTVKDRAEADSADHPAAIEAAHDYPNNVHVCREPFSDTCPIVCLLPNGHPGHHISRTKSDSIETITW